MKILKDIFRVVCATALWSSLSWQSLQAQETPPVARQEEAYRSVVLAWGDVVIPLKLWAEPRYFKGEVTISLEQARAMLSEPVRFYVNGRPHYFDDLRFAALQKPQPSKPVLLDTTAVFAGAPAKTDTAGVFPGNGRESMQQQRVGILPASDLDILLGFLKPGDVFQFTTGKNRQQGIVLSGVAVKVYNEFEEFTPRYYVPPPSYAPTDTVRWQQVRIPGQRRELVRFDPEAMVAAKIRSGFADSSRYELIPLQGFVSGEIFVDESLRVVPVQELASRDTLLTGKVIDRFRVQEVFIRMSENWTLVWGGMQAYAKGPYVKRDSFLMASEKPIVLQRSGKDLPVMQMAFSVVPQKGEPRQYLVNGQDPAVFRKVLLEMPANTTLYFEDVIIRDGDGVLRLVPLTFQLNVW